MLDIESEVDRKLRALYDHIKTQDPPPSLGLITAPASRSRHKVLSRLVAIAAVAAIAAAIGLFAIELSGHRATSPTPTIQPASTPSPKSTPAPTFSPGVTALTAGRHAALVLASGNSYPEYTVVVPKGWFEQAGNFIVTPASEPVLGVTVWDVGEVYRDPCHWQGQAFDPGPGVANLVAALVAQKTRNATTPTDVTLAGYAGKYLEWSVPADMKSSAWSEFDACDVVSGDHNFNSWYAYGVGYRYEEVPGQVDQLWVLDVNGQRLVVDATYSPNTSQGDRAELEQVVDSLRFRAP